MRLLDRSGQRADSVKKAVQREAQGKERAKKKVGEIGRNILWYVQCEQDLLFSMKISKTQYVSTAPHFLQYLFLSFQKWYILNYLSRYFFVTDKIVCESILQWWLYKSDCKSDIAGCIGVILCKKSKKKCQCQKVAFVW